MNPLYFDLETTGTDVKSDLVVEIAAYDPVSNRSFSSLVNPGKEIPEGAIAIHHITDDMVRDAPSFAEVGRDFISFFPSDVVLIAHNAMSFDMPLLIQEGKRHGIDFTCYKVIDTLQWSRCYRPDLPKHQLQFLRKIYNVTENQAHRALDDVFILYQVFSQMIDDLTIDQVYELLKDRSVQKMPFGKYRGQPLERLPPDYIQWLVGQNVFDKPDNVHLKKALVSLGLLSA